MLSFKLGTILLLENMMSYYVMVNTSQQITLTIIIIITKTTIIFIQLFIYMLTQQPKIIYLHG
jgi:hypothetical protein